MPKYQDYERINLKKFKMSWIERNSTIFIYGKTKSGKSFLMRDIFYHFKNIPYGVVFSGTEDINQFFGEFIPPSLIYTDYEPEIVERVLHRQKKKIKDAKSRGIKNGHESSNNCFVVMDDCIPDAKSWKKDKTISTIFMNGRHSNILYFLSSQTPKAIGPELRGNLQYIFLFFDNNLQNRKNLYECFAGFIPSFAHFCDILDGCTENYGCLVIRNDVKSTKLEDLLFYYKAKERPDFRVCHPTLWKLHDEKFNKHYDSDNDKEKDDVIERIRNRGNKKFKTYVVKDTSRGGIERYSDDDSS